MSVSVLGDGAARPALLLRVHEVGAGPSGLAIVLVLYALPVVLLVGVSGRLADRSDPRPVVVVAAVVQLLAALVLAWRTDLVATGAGVLLLQTGFALASSAWVVALTRLVDDEVVGSLVSLQHACTGVAAPVGAAVGGLLVQHAGVRWPFLLDAVTFIPLAGAGLLLLAGAESQAQPGRERGLVASLVPVEGVRALRSYPLLAVLIWTVLPFIVAVESVNAVEVYLVTDVLGGSPSQYGLSEALAGGAVVLGALAAVAARTTAGRVRGTLVALGLVSLCQVGQGLAPQMLVYMPLAAAVGGLLGAINAWILTLMVTATDVAVRGRIVAFVGGASRSCGILALGVGGLLGAALGPRGSFVVVGLAGGALAVIATLSAGPRLGVRGRLRS